MFRKNRKKRGRDGSDASHPIRSDRIPPLAKRASLYLGQNRESFQDSIDELQTILKKYGLLSEKSGVFDENTDRAVKEFQRMKELKADGWVAFLTWAALLYPTLSRHEKLLPENESYVRKLQGLLREEKLKVQINGCFDEQTERALRKFQRRYFLNSDGICGPQTWKALMGQRFEGDFDRSYEFMSVYTEQFLMITSILMGMYFNPFDLIVDIPFINALVTAYGLTFCVQPVLRHFFLEPIEPFDLPLLKYAPYVITGFVWRQIFGVIQQAIV